MHQLFALCAALLTQMFPPVDSRAVAYRNQTHEPGEEDSRKLAYITLIMVGLAIMVFLDVCCCQQQKYRRQEFRTAQKNLREILARGLGNCTPVDIVSLGDDHIARCKISGDFNLGLMAPTMNPTMDPTGVPRSLISWREILRAASLALQPLSNNGGQPPDVSSVSLLAFNTIAEAKLCAIYTDRTNPARLAGYKVTRDTSGNNNLHNLPVRLTEEQRTQLQPALVVVALLKAHFSRFGFTPHPPQIVLELQSVNPAQEKMYEITLLTLMLVKLASNPQFSSALTECVAACNQPYWSPNSSRSALCAFFTFFKRNAAPLSPLTIQSVTANPNHPQYPADAADAMDDAMITF